MHHTHIRSALALLCFFVSGFAATEGSLTVRTDPEGLEVWINERYAGESPIVDKKLEPGEYSVRLVDAVNRNSAVERVVVRNGENTVLEKVLTPRYGTLAVTTDPEGAQVFLSTPLGTTPLSNGFMNPGKYRVEIRHPRRAYEPVADEVTVTQGTRVDISKRLERTTPFDLRALVRLGLGVGAVAGFVWAVVEQGNRKRLDERGETGPAQTAGNRRTAGIILGSACVVGFEIVAFF